MDRARRRFSARRVPVTTTDTAAIDERDGRLLTVVDLLEKLLGNRLSRVSSNLEGLRYADTDGSTSVWSFRSREETFV